MDKKDGFSAGRGFVGRYGGCLGAVSTCSGSLQVLILWVNADCVDNVIGEVILKRGNGVVHVHAEMCC